MDQLFCAAGQPTLVLIGKVPAVGPLFREKEEAVRKASILLKRIDSLIANASLQPYQIMFRRQTDGRYTLAVGRGSTTVDILADIDELLFKRFQRVFRSIFILTCFYAEKEKVECLAVTEGLGAVLYRCSGGGLF